MPNSVSPDPPTVIGRFPIAFPAMTAKMEVIGFIARTDSAISIKDMP